MFTGLVQDVGAVLKIEKGQDSSRVQIQTQLANELNVGDSISVNGVCLTAVTVAGDSFTADVMIQTLKLSNLGHLQEGNKVNAELAARLDTRLGGHIVQGHVDGVGHVVSNEPGEKWHEFVISVPGNLKKYIVNQGSICVDGVSLTVGQINDETNQMTLWLIPETLAKTTLGEKLAGDQVNLEVDVLAKYVERLVLAQQSQNSSQKGTN
ncbi:MAG: riboflavin synthase [Candidatus Nanopelagicaceae bacterium]|nr:riboflavin synthase [Candidatus Nanopelagicaceae bacterium]